MERDPRPDRFMSQPLYNTSEDAMKKLLFATVLAIVAAAPFAASAQDEIIIRKHHERSMPSGGEDWQHRHHDRDRRSDRDRGIQFGVQIGDSHRDWRHRHHRRDCETRYVKHWRHHHRVIEKVTVCS